MLSNKSMCSVINSMKGRIFSAEIFSVTEMGIPDDIEKKKIMHCQQHYKVQSNKVI